MNTNLMNLESLGYREIEEVKNILDAYMRHGVPDDFYDEGTTIEFNPSSDYVFMTNSDYQVCMLTDEGKLESWYSTPYEGHEGFADDLLSELDTSWSWGDVEYLCDIIYNYHKELIEELEKFLKENMEEVEEYKDLIKVNN